LSLEKKFPTVAKALSKLKLRSTILDGEVGRRRKWNSPFPTPSPFPKTTNYPPPSITFFDVLWSDGEELTPQPITDRGRVLDRIIKPTAGIQVGTYVEGEGKALFKLIKENGMEGIIPKRKDSIGLATGVDHSPREP
jgi:ATP-dependent DNA ligase